MQAIDDETLARRLEETGNYRILRKLVPRPVVARTSNAYPRTGVLVDTETTGLDQAKDEVIEIGLVAFSYDEEGRVGDVIATFSSLQEPSFPIPPETTKLTGITKEMVAEKKIPLDQLEAFIENAELVVAHNAAFDRVFCERLTPGFSPKAWACSQTEVDWSGRGFEGTKLSYLVGQSGYFHEKHRATDDCHALLEVLTKPGSDGAGIAFSELLRNAQKARVRIWAENTQFSMKDHLKKRGYRWSDGNEGRLKAWWTDVPEEALEDELRFLRAEIYCWPDASPHIQRLTAFERFKAQG